MKSCLLLAVLALTACGVDGPPENPIQPLPRLEKIAPQRGTSGNFYDERGVMRTPANTISVGGDATIGVGVNL